MNEKINKYISKFNENTEKKSLYLHKLSKHCYENMKGGGKLKSNNLDSLLSYIKEKTDNGLNVKKSKKNYFVILYGPPASGKSLARKIACQKIVQEFEPDFSPQELFNTFVDTGVDEIIYDIDSISNNLEKQFKEYGIEHNLFKSLSYTDALKKPNNNDANKSQRSNPLEKKIVNIDEVKKHIEEIAKNSFAEYSKGKRVGDIVSDLFKYITIFLGKNMFIETASYYRPYWITIINQMIMYGYIPIIIYPHTYNYDLLCERSIQRGLAEYRFLTCDGNYGIKNKAKDCEKSFPILKDDLIEASKNNYLIYVYDAEIEKSEYDKYSNGYGNVQNIKMKYENIRKMYKTQDKNVKEIKEIGDYML